MFDIGEQLICTRDFTINDSHTIYKTPRGISSELFLKNYLSFGKCRQTNNEMRFSKDDEIEIIAYGLKKDYEYCTIRVLHSKNTVAYAHYFTYHEEGIRQSGEQVFFSINPKFLPWFIKKDAFPEKKKFDSNELLVKKNYVMKYPLHYISKVNEHIFEFQVTELYGSSDEYNYFEMSQEIKKSVQTFCDLHFKGKTIVKECVHYGFRMNPDRVGVHSFLLISPRKDMDKAKESLSMNKEEFPHFPNFYNTFYHEKDLVESLMKHFSALKRQLEPKRK